METGIASYLRYRDSGRTNGDRSSDAETRATFTFQGESLDGNGWRDMDHVTFHHRYLISPPDNEAKMRNAEFCAKLGNLPTLPG